MSSVAPPPAAESASVDFAWTSWPLRDAGLRAWPPLILVVLLIFVAGSETGSLALAAVAALALTAAAWRYLVPIRYEIHARGVTQSVLGRATYVPWTAIGSHRVTRDGVLLLRPRGAVPFDLLGGLFVPWGPRRDDVQPLMERYLTALPPGDAQSS